ncbi:hypothetical protein Taro_009623 [Colocasia esculenta]|uniref:Ubiquitin-like protease family profile domain-containing protein n=1 Tax=Colocasia esculenta TaxID=4460 RepID=A0A843U5E9_COLES|nr:hypothetical protein [Colocasia esculenta]
MPFEGGGNGGNLLAAALQTSVPRTCPLRRGDLLFGSAAKRTPGLPFGCAAKRSAEILTDSHFLPSIPRVDTTKWPIIVPSPCPQQGAGDDCALFVCKFMECLANKNVIGLPFSQADMDLMRGKLASAIIQKVNGEKENRSIGEAAVEIIVSLSDEA